MKNKKVAPKEVGQYAAVNLFDPVFSKLEPGKPVMVGYETQLVHRRGITLKDLVLMKDNFEKKVLGVEVPFDENHQLGKAYGWAESLFMGEVDIKGEKKVALFANPKWNPAGKKSVDECEYIYTSPSIFWEWINPMTGEKFHSVLRSISLLNDPQLINQPPVKMSTENVDEETSAKGEQHMEKFAALLLSLGATFAATDVTEDIIVAKAKEMFAAEQVKTKTAEDKAATVTKEFDTFKAEYSPYKKQVDDFKAAEKKDKVDKVVELSKTRIAPAKADDFKALAEKDVVQAEQFLAMLDPTLKIDTLAPGHAGGDQESFSNKQAEKEKFIADYCSKMAEKSDKKPESFAREGLQKWEDEQKAKADKAKEGGK